MARRKRHGRKTDLVTKIFKGLFKIGSKLLIGGPVLVPGAAGLEVASRGDFKNVVPTFVYEASGYNMNSHSLDQGKLQEVAIRDAVLVGVGLAVRWVGRHV